MVQRIRLHVVEDLTSQPVKLSEKTVRLARRRRTLDEVLSSDNTAWRVEQFDESGSCIQVCELATAAMIEYLQTGDADVLQISVSDYRQCIGLLLRPRVPIDLPGSEFEYFDRDAIIEHILESFLRDINVDLHDAVSAHRHEGPPST